ncbi:hypothetical protein D3C87_1820830 [compost metagenome]
MLDQILDLHPALLDLVQSVIVQLGKPGVEQDVDLRLVDMPVGLAAGIVNRHGCAIGHRVVDAIFVEIAFARHAKILVGVLVVLLHWRAGEAEEAGVRQRRAQIGAEIFFLGAMCLVHHHDPVLRLGDRLLRPLELEDGG